MNRKPPFIENSDEGIPLMFTESHVRVATPEESILWERLQAALSVDRECDRLVEENDGAALIAAERERQVERERDRLVEAARAAYRALENTDRVHTSDHNVYWANVAKVKLRVALSSSPTEQTEGKSCET